MDDGQTEVIVGEGAVMPAARTAITPMEMLSRAISTGAGIDVVERLITLMDRHQANEARKSFYRDLSAAKAEIRPILKQEKVNYANKGGGRTEYDHESMSGIAREVDPILSRHGLSYRYRAKQEGQSVIITCIVFHRDGHSEEVTLSGWMDSTGNKNPNQGLGSAATYLQRYTLKLALGLSAAKDDDARSASDNARAPETISADQYIVLRDKLDETGDDPEALEKTILGYFKIEGLEFLPAGKFSSVMAQLERRAKEKEISK